MEPVNLNLGGISSARWPNGAEGIETAGAAESTGLRFEDVLTQSIEKVNDFDREAQGKIAGLLTGEDLTQAEVFTAVKKADLAFRTMLQIRNKLLEAYREIEQMRM